MKPKALPARLCVGCGKNFAPYDETRRCPACWDEALRTKRARAVCIRCIELGPCKCDHCGQASLHTGDNPQPIHRCAPCARKEADQWRRGRQQAEEAPSGSMRRRTE